MIKLMKKYNNSKDHKLGNMFKGMITLVIGAGFARGIGILSIPILTRLYSPEDYGVLALYISITSVIIPCLTLRYVQAIPLPTRDVMGGNLLSLCFKLVLITSIIIFIIFYFFAERIFTILNMSPLIQWWPLIVLGSLGAAIFEIFSFWRVRKKSFKSIAKAQVYQSIIGSVAKIGLSFVLMKPLGLILGQLLNQSVGTKTLIGSRFDLLNIMKSVDFKKEKLLFFYYQDFMWYRLPSHILMVLSVQAPYLMMASLYGSSATGQLALAIMVISIPTSLISSGIAKAYFAEVASIGRTDLVTIRQITHDLQKRLFLVGVPSSILIFIFSEFLFVFFFGSEWALAGKYAAILAPYILFQFTSSPLMEVVNVIGKQAIFLFLHGIRASGLIILYLLLNKLKIEQSEFVIIISLYLSLFYLSASLLVFFILNKEVKRHGKKNYQ